MFNLEFIPHKEVTQEFLDKIIEVKSTAWPYSYEDQLDWINANLKDTDIHVLLYWNKTIQAYLNLIEIEFTLDGNLINGFGIGNVCAKEKGNGWGKELIKQTNRYLTQNNKVGLLFCKEILVRFYSLNNWRLIEKKKLTLSGHDESVETMIFNWEKGFQQLKYIGKPF
jgi:hypothetical protein